MGHQLVMVIFNVAAILNSTPPNWFPTYRLKARGTKYNVSDQNNRCVTVVHLNFKAYRGGVEFGITANKPSC